MIIVSQDKLKIINFDNIDSVEVDANVIVVFKNNKRIWIGTYDTIIRAKEVLEQIYLNYSDFELIKNIRSEDYQKILINRK